MTRNTPRVEFHFPVAQTAEDLSYVPDKTQDESLVPLYENGPKGIRIVKDQKFGNVALARTFDWAAENGDDQDLQGVARLASYIGLGTAFHLYAEGHADQVMYRKPDLAKAIDFDTGKPVDPDDLLLQASAGLHSAAHTSKLIEAALHEQRTRQLNRLGVELGKSMAGTAMIAAAIADNVTEPRAGSIELQNRAYGAGTRAYIEMLQLSGKIDARVTAAQLANPYSPLMVHLNAKNKRLSIKRNKVKKEPLLTKSALANLNENIHDVMANEPRP